MAQRGSKQDLNRVAVSGRKVVTMTTERTQEDRADSVSRQLENSAPGAAGQTASPANESPVSPDEVTDDAPETAHGVGASTTRQGNEMVDKDGKEAGREDTGTSGGTNRPTGTSDERDSSGASSS